MGVPTVRLSASRPPLWAAKAADGAGRKRMGATILNTVRSLGFWSWTRTLSAHPTQQIRRFGPKEMGGSSAACFFGFFSLVSKVERNYQPSAMVASFFCSFVSISAPAQQGFLPSQILQGPRQQCPFWRDDTSRRWAS